MKRTTILILLSLLIFTIACDEDNASKAPNAPKLLVPSNDTVISEKTIQFRWSLEQDGEVYYTLMISKDSINWDEFGTMQSRFCELSENVTNSYTNYYAFDYGIKYYWKVKIEYYNYSDNFVLEDEGPSYSETFNFYTGPTNVKNLQAASGYENVKLSWENAENIEYVEISIDPTVNGIDQPIKLEKGINEYQIDGLVNGELYSFYIKSFNKLNHGSANNTIKAMPLDPTQVHDADFNIYNITKIGDQTWLRENLQTTKWQDGTKMGNNYITNGDYSPIYGYYYYATSTFGEEADGKNPCPCGYHVPTDDEWNKLELFLGMPESEVYRYTSDLTNFYRGEGSGVANALKSSSGWQDFEGSSGNGTDIFKFNLLPANYYWGPSFQENGTTILHTSTKNINYYYYRAISYESDGIGRYSYDLYGSIRCIKD